SGAMDENPARTKKAAPKPSQGGPGRSARTDSRKDNKSAEPPARIHLRESRTDCSIRAPWCRVSTGLRFAAARAGNQAAASTETRPSNTALLQVHGAMLISRTLSRT